MTKRLIDIVASAIALVALAPLLLVIALAVRCTSQGPVIYSQRRVGRNGREFWIYKFRSMRHAPEARQGPLVTASGDSRITSVGRVLRKAKLDELPQLWNVLIGDMSLVGPRPEVPEYVAQYTSAQREILAYRPGITCVSSLEMFDEESVLAAAEDPEALYRNVIMPEKLQLALDYAKGANTWSDCFLIGSTLGRIARGGERPSRRAA